MTKYYNTNNKICVRAQRSIYFMAKVDQLVSSLQKLQSKRSALDKQIAEAEKKLVVEVKAAAKPAASAGKPAAKKPAAKRAARKPTAPKSAEK
jgi:hypothetical protein